MRGLQTGYAVKSAVHVCGVLLLLFIWANVHAGAATRRPVTLVVSAAASVTFAFQVLGTRFQEATGTNILFNFGSSGQLAQQIERGAPVDVFAAANTAFIEMLQQQDAIISETKALYARGRLTLWTRDDSPLRLTGLEALTRPEVRRLAIANPTHAPYGVAARQALQSAGIWDQIQSKLVMGEDVRQTMQYAATGNVEAAIVALSLSVQHQGRWVLIPEGLHQPLNQSLAVIKRTPHELQARRFVAFVTGSQGQAVLRQYGFDIPSQKGLR